MKLNELNPYTFKALRQRLGHDRQRDPRPMWQARLSDDSDFCRAMVGCGCLTRKQMQRAARRYRLGRSRDGGVIFWQIDQLEQVFDGRIILFPDTDTDGEAFSTWYRVTQEAQRLLGQTIHLSPLLEQHATPSQKKRKIDIADFMFETEDILDRKT